MKNIHHYTVIFEPDEDGVFIARVPALPGCHSFGDTLEEAEKNIQEAILCYIEGLLEVGEAVPQEEPVPLKITKSIQVNLTSV